MHKVKLVAIVAFVLALLGGFLPWASFMGFSVSGFSSGGVVAVILLAIPVVLAFMGDKSAVYDEKQKKIVLGVDVAALAFMIWKLIQLISSPSVGQISAFKLVGIGFWLSLLSTIVAFGGILAFNKESGQ